MRYADLLDMCDRLPARRRREGATEDRIRLDVRAMALTFGSSGDSVTPKAEAAAARIFAEVCPGAVEPLTVYAADPVPAL